jgi:hypothetical protein
MKTVAFIDSYRESKGGLLTLVVFFLLLQACDSSDTQLTNANGENISILIAPVETDANYATSDYDHYVVRNTKKHVNKLLLFIGGSFSIPENYNLVCDHAASIGLDVVSLSYPNNVATAPLGASSNPLIFDTYRDELCFGNSVSDVVDVNTLNSINTRTIKLLQYLALVHPEQNWQQYLTTTNTLVWSKIVLSGHSQGSGHACFLGKKNTADRVIMFAGPNDYHSFFDAAANWLTVTGQTPLTKQYALLHFEDEIVPFTNQVSNLRGLGLLTNTENPIAADNLLAPYSNAHVLSINIAALSNHNSPVGGSTILPNIWTYLFIGE